VKQGKELTVRPEGLSTRVLLAVRGGSPGSTEAYRGAVQAFIAWANDCGRGLGAEALAEYVTTLPEDGVGAGKLNMALYASKKELLQAAQRAGMAAASHAR
jgi:hypothetical protein